MQPEADSQRDKDQQRPDPDRAEATSGTGRACITQPTQDPPRVREPPDTQVAQTPQVRYPEESPRHPLPKTTVHQVCGGSSRAHGANAPHHSSHTTNVVAEWLSIWKDTLSSYF